MQDATLSSILVQLLEAKLQAKQAEGAILSQLIGYSNQRRIQIEVERQQLHELLTTARHLMRALGRQ